MGGGARDAAASLLLLRCRSCNVAASKTDWGDKQIFNFRWNRAVRLALPCLSPLSCYMTKEHSKACCIIYSSIIH